LASVMQASEPMEPIQEQPIRERPSADEERIDDIVAETFPASDSPAWNATHAGHPVTRIPVAQPTHDVMRAQLRLDLERLGQPYASAEERRHTREDTLSRALLSSGRAVIREPVDADMRIRTMECEQLGAMRDASCVIVGARYDARDVSGVAALLAVSRALAGVDSLRSIRFVAFPSLGRASGAEAYVERLSRSGVSVHAMVSLARLDLTRDHEATLLVVGNLSSRRIVRRAARAFEMASRVAVRGVALPSWVPGVGSSESAAFWRAGWPAVMVADGPLWRVRSPAVPDVDRIAAAVPGLVAAVSRLAES
jgi:hypothetical protein